jgi:periplasmic mercuric ion binding protein
MKTFIASVLVALGLSFSAHAAEFSTKVSNVHLCCQGCVRAVEKAVAETKGVTAVADQETETVTLTGPDKNVVQKAADALVAAGYYGKSSDSSIKLASESGAKGKNVQSLKLEGVHLCCGKCVSVLDKAVKAVPGVKEHTAKKNAESFEVTGDFNDQQVIEALQKAGLAAKVAK